MLENSQLSGNFSALNSNPVGTIARLYLSSQSLASTSELIDPIQQQLSLFSSSTLLNTQAASLSLPAPTNLILDFDGATLSPGGKTSTGQDYALPIDLPIEDGQQTSESFDPFKGFSSNSSRNEQILQILSGVREDFARFNVRVIWDDRGVNSPFFDNNSTVIVITDSNPNIIRDDPTGISPSPLDDSQIRPDVALAFTTPLLNSSGFITNTRYRLGNLINTISHEAGHTFGLRHPTLNPVREIMDSRLGDASSDRQFTSARLPRDDDSNYDDEGRLNQNLGGALASPPNDQVSNQTLANDPARVPRLGETPTQSFIQQIGTVDFLGDRDAFQFEVSKVGIYTIRESAAPSSLLNPAFTLWNSSGDFVPVGSGIVNTISVKLDVGIYYAIAGSAADQATEFTETDPTTGAVKEISGNLPNGQIGNYVLEIGNSAPIAVNDQFTAVEDSSFTGSIFTNDSDPDGNAISIVSRSSPAHGTLTLNNTSGSFTYAPDRDFFGTDTFTYQITDGLALSKQAIVSFTIAEAPLIDLIGTPGRDVLTGTNGRNRIIGLQSGDVLTGGNGRDQFVFQNINEGGDRITDFTIGKDKVVLSGVLQSISYHGLNPIADGIISFRQASPNLAVLQIDPDGSNNATFKPVPFILFDNLSVAALRDPSNFIV